MKYYITHKSSVEKGAKIIRKRVEGDEVVVKGFEEFDFFVHKPAWDDDCLFGNYIVSEKSTGSVVRCGWTKKEAIDKTITILNAHGLKDFKKIIKKYLRLMNRNKKVKECDATMLNQGDTAKEQKEKC